MNFFNKNKILHVGSAGKFVSSHYRLLEENFSIQEHEFYLLEGIASCELVGKNNVVIFKLGILSIKNYLSIAIRMCFARKILLHGMNDPRIIIILWMFPFLLRKIVWVLWGGDLYEYLLKNKNLKMKIKEYCKASILKKIQTITTTIPKDYELACEWYGVKANYIENLMYESHTARLNFSEPKFETSLIKIQLGNSATKSNQHFEIIDLLAKINGEFIVYAPLSYGEPGYKDLVVEYGCEKLGEKFKPLIDFMPFEEYNKYMETIDVAIFNHPRQQGMGNIIGMLSLGKKVYLNSKATPFSYFKDKKFIVGDVSELPDIKLLTLDEVDRNKKNASLLFNKEILIKGWRKVYES